MTFKYNGYAYTVETESTYKEIIIAARNPTDACDIVNAVDGMTDYEFNGTTYSGMVVKRRQINIDGDSITVRIITREQTDLEKANSEISAIRSAIQELDVSEEVATKHPILFPDIHKVDKVIPGNYYLVNGVVSLITDVIDENAEGQYVSRPAKGGGK